MNRLEVLNDIIDRHIESLDDRRDPILSDTKNLTEILKAILVLEQIKKIQGGSSHYDHMSDEELSEKIEKFS